MAITYNFDGTELVQPGAYSKISVATNNSGLSTTGVLMLVGESTTGPSFTSETDLESNAYGPDQLAEVEAKYGTGPLVDAFRAAVLPSNVLQGTFSRAVLVKTNASTKASGALLNSAAGSYGTLFTKLEGSNGNLISYAVTAATTEVVPTTGAFTFIPPVDTTNATFRISGAAALSVSLTASKLGTLTVTPATFKTDVDALAGLNATGGVDRVALTVSGTLAFEVDPASNPGVNNVLVTRSVPWAVTPSVGDTVTIPTGSIIAGRLVANVGAYVVTAATSTTISMTKISDAGKNGAVAGTVTAPTEDRTVAADGLLLSSPGTIVAVTELTAYSPVVISVDTGSVVDGIQKTLEINELTTGLDLLSRTAYVLGTTTPVTFISKVSAPTAITSSAEYSALLTLTRSTDSASEELTSGGTVALNVSYVGTTATLTVDKTARTISTTVAGGAGGSIPAIAFASYPTLNDFVVYLNSQTGYTASVTNASIGNLPLSALDSGVFNICSTFGASVGKIKTDAYRFFEVVSKSGLVQLGSTPAAANSGLPAVKAASFLSGGSKGGSTAASVAAGIAALENVRGNFLIPLFSRDAAADIVLGLTESTSTYTIDAVNLLARTHVLKMSTIKKRRNRQGFVSKDAAFAAQKTSASNLASARVAMAFQNAKQVASSGNIQQYPSWMTAVLAAATQAAAFYRGIINKPVNTGGFVHAAGDFNEKSDTDMESAILAGLLPAKKSDSGGFVFVEDQTTYTADGSEVFNSVQAVYVADVIALTTAQRMENAFVGVNVSDASASIGLIFLEGIMSDLLRQKLLAVSDDAPKGYKNATVKISGSNMIVSLSVFLNGIIRFIPITFQISTVTQSA